MGWWWSIGGICNLTSRVHAIKCVIIFQGFWVDNYGGTNMPRFVLTGLPGTGKTTTLKAYVESLNKRGIEANFISTDVLINERINADDPVIRQYEKDNKCEILPTIFIAEDCSYAFRKAYGEDAIRDLEERFLIDIIESSKECDWLDFGGRALLLPEVVRAVKAKKIMTVFLYAEHETIIERLRENEGWRQRPTYMLAAEAGSDGTGWMMNAKIHRDERLQIFIENADIVITVDDKSPATIVHEIVMELAISKVIDRRAMGFFESQLSKDSSVVLESTADLRNGDAKHP